MRAKREEALQQAREFNLHQTAQRRASEVQRSPQQQPEHQQLSRDSRPSPSSSPASLPNNGTMAPPTNANNTGNSNIVNTPQSMTTSLPQQSQNNMPVRHTSSPSFSPRQMQRGAEIMAQQQPQTPHVGEAMINSPMTNQQLQQAQQQQQMLRNHNVVVAAMNACGLAGRDQSTLTAEEKVKGERREYKNKHCFDSFSTCLLLLLLNIIKRLMLLHI